MAYPQSGQPAYAAMTRMHNLVNKAARDISLRARLFSPDRTEEDLAETIRQLHACIGVHMAVAWAISLFGMMPSQHDATADPGNSPEQHASVHTCLAEFCAYIFEHHLLPDYRVGYLAALLTASHMTREEQPQLRLWNEFKLQVSNLFASLHAHSEIGVQMLGEDRRRMGLESALSDDQLHVTHDLSIRVANRVIGTVDAQTADPTLLTMDCISKEYQLKRAIMTILHEEMRRDCIPAHVGYAEQDEVRLAEHLATCAEEMWLTITCLSAGEWSIVPECLTEIVERYFATIVLWRGQLG